jgi:starch-binding outer membrane protein, SusD/RagB family
MKKIAIIILAFVLSLNISCTDWLEENQYDKINSEILYTSPQGLNAAMGGVYSLTRKYFRFIDSQNTRSNYWFYCADDLGVVRTYNEATIYRESMTPSAMPSDIWVNGYQLVDRASAIIVNAQKVAMPETDRKKLLSEAKVVRAMAYLRMISVYDNILLDTIPTDIKNAFDPIEYKPATQQQIYDLINADLDYAIANLSYIVKPGIIGQAIARQLRAESAMWTGDYATAATHCDAVISSGTYTLMPADQVFGQDVNHKETLLAWQFDELLGGSDNLAGGSGSPLGAAFNARFYEITIPGETEKPIIEDNTYGGNCFGWTFPNAYLKSLYDKTKDKRFSAYFYPEVLIGNNPKSKYFGKPLPGNPPYSTQLRQYSWSVMKYRDFLKPAGRALSYKDLIAYRLAETYLMGAEAHWRNGNNAKAIAYLNKVRSRAGLDDATSIDLQAIMDENARELCFEGKRWFFLKRIGKLVSQVNQYHKFGSTTTNIVAFPMKDHQVRWPIPQSQMDVMGSSFPQNTGY